MIFSSPGVVGPLGEDDAEHRLAELRPQVRHHPHQVDPGQRLVQGLERSAGQDREHRRARLSQVGRDLVEDVGLDRQDDQVGGIGECDVALDRLAADLVGESLRPRVVGVGEEHLLGSTRLAAGRRPATREATAHVSGADEPDSHDENSIWQHPAR